MFIYQYYACRTEYDTFQTSGQRVKLKKKEETPLRVFRHLLISKLDRKLTLEEFHWILGKVEDDDHTMPLVIYLRELLPLPAEELFVFDDADLYEVMLIACLFRNHGWICG